MECGGLKTKSLLSGAQRAEVLGGLGHNIVAELHNDASNGLTIGSHVKVHSG